MITVTVYKDRTGQWRWNMTGKRRLKLGGSLKSFRSRRIARRNLANVTGLWLPSPKHIKGTIKRQYASVGERNARMYL